VNDVRYSPYEVENIRQGAQEIYYGRNSSAQGSQASQASFAAKKHTIVNNNEIERELRMTS